jgi:hypothetical protein
MTSTARYQAASCPNLVWNTGGCSSWYLDRTGRNATIWPDFTFRFRAQMRRFDAHAYELTTSGDRATHAPCLAPAWRG